MNNHEIRLSGSGGQGIITAGIILAEAALLDGRNALQSQSYGPEARGGASKAEVIISDEEIDYPKVSAPGILLALTQEAFNNYVQGVTAEGVILVDESITANPSANQHIFRLPILETAQARLRPVVANIIALGAMAKLTGCVSLDALEKAVLARVPRGTEDLNKRALATGVELAENQQKYN
ncbi:MAG: 2-oxoacid:acceptor oxidoreductase family protein [Symbiobacteriaceae bacterium]|nr:2-oxoacid:acceptor oxidoreductase family protein [Symbiobacteriaceae bacterium]